MKTSAVLASLLFGSFAVAAPVDKRALVYKTEVVTETVVVFTTVYDDDVPEATTTPAGYFYEKPNAPSSAAVKVTSAQAPAYTPPVAPVPEQKPSSAKVEPVPQAPTPTPAPAPAPVVEQPKESPKPVEQPKPVETPTYVAPPPAASSPAPAAPVTPSKPTTGDSTVGTYSGDITIYEPNGGYGACGTSLSNSEFIAALSKDAWGSSTYDVMTGAATNKWCGQKITAYYNGRKVDAVIQDMCPGCKGDDIDLSPAAWKELTGSDEKTRYQATWSKSG